MKPSLSKASAKPDHLDKIRYHIAYPIFRFVCSVVKVFSYIAAVIVAVGGDMNHPATTTSTSAEGK